MSVTIVSSSPGRVVLARSPWTGRLGRSNPVAGDSARRPEGQVPQQRSAPPELGTQPKLRA